MKWYSYLVRENIFGIGIQAVGLLAGFASALIFPNIMGKTEFGYFTLAITMATTWLLLGDAGINQVALKFIPEGEKAGKTKKYYDYLIRWKILLSFFAALLLFLGGGLIADLLGIPGADAGFRVAGILVLIWSLTTYFEVVLFALRATRNVFISNAIYQVIRVALPVLFYIYLFPKQLVWALIGVVIAYVITLPLLAFWVRQRMPSKEKTGGLKLDELKEYWKYSFVGYLGTTMFMNLDPIVVGFSLGPADVAAYRVAWLWITSVTIFSVAASRILLSAHARESEERSRAILSRAIKYVFAGSFLAIAGLVVLSSKMLTLFYKGNYSESYPVMAILSLLVLETFLNSITSPVLLGKGRVKLQTKISLATGCLQLIAMLLVTPGYGIIGTAVAVVSVRLLFSFVTAGYALSILKVKVPLAHYAVPIASAAAAVLLLGPYARATHDVLGVVMAGIGVTVVYSAIVLLFRIVTVKEALDLGKSAL